MKNEGVGPDRVDWYGTHLMQIFPLLQVADYEDVCLSEEMSAFLAEESEAESAARERLTADGLTQETRALMAGVGGYVRKAIVAVSNINMTDPGFRNRLRDRVAAEVIRQNRIRSSGEQTVAALCAKLARENHGRRRHAAAFCIISYALAIAEALD